MDKKLVVSPSPHIHSGASTQNLMRDVIIALVPAFIVSVLFYGLPALITTAIAVCSAVIFEFLISKYILNVKPSICDYSAALTGFLLAFNLPSDISWWIVVIGSLVAIGIAKMSYGGLGKNLFNPALVGRVVLLISFPAQMTTFSMVQNSAEVDATSGATFLTFVKSAVRNDIPLSEALDNIDIFEMLIGKQSGSLGEISAIALLLGFAYLLYRKVITWHIPVSVLGAMIVFSGILWAVNSDVYLNPVYQIVSGGALLGAIYMATDYVTSPMNPKGMIIFGVGIGVITILIRTWGAYAEGMSFAILIMNAATPLINKYTRPKRFGEIVK
ncbi:MAG: RnfABCDGE type electron transport complex subunit D [Rikenellaceae bacterium]